VIFVSEYKKAKKSEDIDTVWKKYDEKLAIIQGLTTYVGEKADIKIDKPKKENAPVAETKKVETEKEDKKEPDDKKSDDDGEDDGDFNPMAFFGSGG
jgi:hypothetical protein